MTAKEKANELLDNYLLMDFINPSLSKQQAKKCALIAVNEILNNDKVMPYIIISYWKEVKKEIKKL